MIEYVSTEDTSTIARVWASFSYDYVFPEIDPDADDDSELYDFDYEPRLSQAYDRMADAIAKEFPNATDIMIESTGWEGSHAQFSPRAETADGTPYEHFDEWLADVCDSLSN